MLRKCKGYAEKQEYMTTGKSAYLMYPKTRRTTFFNHPAGNDDIIAFYSLGNESIMLSYNHHLDYIGIVLKDRTNNREWSTYFQGGSVFEVFPKGLGKYNERTLAKRMLDYLGD